MPGVAVEPTCPPGAEDSKSKKGVGSEMAWVGAMLHGERVRDTLDAGLVWLSSGPSTEWCHALSVSPVRHKRSASTWAYRRW